MHFHFPTSKQMGKNKRPMGHIAHLKKQLNKHIWLYRNVDLEKKKKNIINFIIIYCFLHLKKLESPSPKDALCQVWLKLAQWFWRTEFFNFVNIFSLFPNYLPLKKGGALQLKKLNPLHPGILCAKFGRNWPSGFGEEGENVKSLQTDRQTDRQTTDDRWSEKLTWAFSSGELKMINLMMTINLE